MPFTKLELTRIPKSFTGTLKERFELSRSLCILRQGDVLVGWNL